MPDKPIRVIVVDDSALMRQMLTTMLNADPDIEVVFAAPDPYVARDKIKQLNPDVLTLDIEMPRMDGLSFLSKIMSLRPMPVVMVSSLTQEGAEATVQALEVGAVDFVGKPAQDLAQGLSEKQAEIIAKVKAAANARVRRTDRSTAASRKPLKTGIGFSSTEKVVAIGASTGGVEAIRDVVIPLPADSPAILVTQHMPEKFTTSFAERLNKMANVSVSEARHNERVLPGHVYIAPGDQHLELARSGANYVCRLHDQPPVSGHRPSVDVLFSSVAKVARANAVGVILTGMGRDGAEGLKCMRDAGANTIGQDENTCVVYGMPKAAFEAGGVETQVGIGKVGEAILACCGSRAVRAVRV